MMLGRVFFSLSANVMFVLTGVLKQYMVARSLSVADFGAYGSLVALASFALVLLPFPAYLDVMLRGFSAPARAFGSRKRLLLSGRHETAAVAVSCALGAALACAAALAGWGAGQSLAAVLLLLVGQYGSALLDITLRMQQAHRRLAWFMALRNVPVVLLFITWPPQSPLHAVMFDFICQAGVCCLLLVWAPELRTRHAWHRRWLRLSASGQRLMLWLARLAQFGNSSLLRLLVPLAFGAHETGLFFFALIAQLPCSLVLSVTTQMCGHALARLQPGQWRSLWKMQAVFMLPNAAYALFCFSFAGWWPWALGYVPSLAKYAEAGPLIVSAVVYAAVLASDCQEYLLRSRGLSGGLLAYSLVSVVVQAVVVACGWSSGWSLPQTLSACAGTQAVVLFVFSARAFRLVMLPNAQARFKI